MAIRQTIRRIINIISGADSSASFGEYVIRFMRWLFPLGTAGMSAWYAQASAWLDTYGPVAWWFAALLGGLIALAMLWLFSWVRYQWIRADAQQRWVERADEINPLASEFTRKRIKVSDLSHPITRRIENKFLHECDLFGPANIAVYKGSHIEDVSFWNCDLVVVKPAAKITTFNVTLIENVRMLKGSIWNCTVYVPPAFAKVMVESGANPLTLTGDPEIDGLRLGPPREKA